MASVDDLVSSLKNLDANSFSNELDRARTRDALFEALMKVQSPWDIVWHHNWVNGATHACIKTLIDVGLFERWAKDGHAPKTCVELAKLTGSDEVLIRRMMRQLSGQYLVLETEEDTFATTPWARALATDPPLTSIYGTFYSEINNPLFSALPQFLKQSGFKNPTNARCGNWQHLRGPESTYFQFVGANPSVTREFNDTMECHSKYNLTPWVDIYPTETIFSTRRDDRALVVDVGGGKGHDLEKFIARHPDARGLMLQDLPEILIDVTPAARISLQPHDFFTPQPVKGARVYLMHNLLHDWEDPEALVILRHTAEAMAQGYSKLLIHESVVNSVKPHARVTTSDITMMACLSAKERAESEWMELVENAELRVLQVWGRLQSVESIIEVELSDVYGKPDKA